MKEIKFRDWDGEQFNYNIMWEPGGFYYYEICTEVFCGCQEYGRTLIKKAWDVSQYLNVKDVNDKEIYENDIVFHPIYGNCLVTYCDTTAEYEIYSKKYGTLRPLWRQLTVVSSVYENPKLLENG